MRPGTGSNINNTGKDISVGREAYTLWYVSALPPEKESIHRPIGAYLRGTSEEQRGIEGERMIHTQVEAYPMRYSLYLRVS